MQTSEKTLGQIINGLAKDMPDATAVEYTTREYRRTWREFDEDTDKVAKGLMALGVEKGDPDSMTRPPERAERAILNRSSLLSIACSGAYICWVTLFAYAFALYNFGNAVATTMAFMTVSFAELFHAFNVRSERRSAFGRGALSNKVLLGTVIAGVAANIILCISPLAGAFGIAPLSAWQWAVVFGLSLSVVIFGEIYKFLARVVRSRGARTTRSIRTDRKTARKM